jgi:methionyl-tRNA formyltransferase
MRIVFMGTPEFAVPSLRKLAESRHDIVGVVTQPDRPKGRGLSLAASAVKLEAQRLHIPITQPEDLNHPEFLAMLKAWRGDCFVVVGFRILPAEVFEMPKKGTVNLHASLLPKYRGAAPIQWALIHGEKKTGVTTFFIDQKVDTGDLILQDELSIGSEETAGELHDRLAVLGADLVVRTLDLVEQGRAERIPQQGIPTRAPKILPEHCEICWNSRAEDIVNLIRGLSPVPGAFTFWEGKRLKIFRASTAERSTPGPSSPGRVVDATEERLIVDASDGAVSVRDIQIEGKRRMEIGEFLRGIGMRRGAVLSAAKER